MQRIHCIVRGLVQGVGFRYFCAREAERLGLSGFARNRSDGTVEVEAQGSEQELETFIHSLQKGPERSQVEFVDVDEREVLPSEQGFVIR